MAKTLLRRLFGRRRRLHPGPVQDTWTPYLSWLTFANAGMLVRGNVGCIEYALGHLPSASPLIEIGSFCGLSTNIIGYFKQRLGIRNTLITCDKWEFEGADSGKLLDNSTPLTHSEYREFVKASYLRNIQTFSRTDLPYTIEAFSDEFFQLWAAGAERQDVLGRSLRLGGPISFAFIDGNHTYEFARRDFENCDRYLEPGGFLLFDDSADGSDWEVCRVVREVAKSGRYELVARNPNYLFRKR